MKQVIFIIYLCTFIKFIYIYNNNNNIRVDTEARIAYRGIYV